MIKTRLIRLRGVESQNVCDQIAFFAFHSFLVEVQPNKATYVWRMRNNNLEIRTSAGSSFYPQSKGWDR